MAKVTLTADVTLDMQSLLDGVAQLDTPDLEKIYTSIGLMLAHRKSGIPVPSTLSVAEDTAENIPIVETLIPKSISFG